MLHARRKAAAFLTLALIAVIPTTTPAHAATTPATTALSGYRIQSTAKTTDTGATISQPGYAATSWHPAGPRSTVVAALLADGTYPADPFYSTNLKNIPAADFTVPWWYRSEFTLADEPGTRTYLDFSGVVSKADVFVNGVQVATSSQVAGAYNRQEIDVTAQARIGVNAVAFKVYPNDPNKDLTVGWIDWVQNPPDRNMGIFRDVLVRRNGSVALRGAHVLTSVTGALDSATLTAKVDARNDTAAAVTATIAGTVAGRSISTSVTLAAHETRTVAFAPVTLASPQIWWPATMGAQPLYDLSLSASVSGAVSDQALDHFGVRTVSGTLDAGGHRAYKINGRPILIKGGGWSPDLFLRWDPTSVEDRLKYALDLGLNTIRLEGHLEPDEFFDLADRMGVLVLPGWECCDKWEGDVNGSEPGDTWAAADRTIAQASMKSEAVRLRDHPSVISFLIGSDFAPQGTIESNYVAALNAADWSTPIVSAASDSSSPISGASGMKMTGPYDWVPPNYWTNKREGGAFGFNSETSAGPDIPTLDSLRRMMSTSELDTLWQNFTASQYHRSPSSTFGTLKIFDNALAGRYGAPTSLTDYVRKAQLAQYENIRAQFEAYGRNFSDSSNPATGVVYWMFNSAWTSLHWQLFDYYLDQGGSYFGAKKANEPLHIQYGYDNKAVVVVNNRHAAASGLTAKVSVYNTDGTQKYTQTVANLGVNGDGQKASVLTLPSISGLSSTYLLKLTLTDGTGAEVDRNVYWLSTAPDTIDWANNDWYYVPTTAYANLQGLAAMPNVPVSNTSSTVNNADGTSTTTVTLRNTATSGVPALTIDAHVVRSSGAPVLPIQWSDNQVTLWPGESTTITGTYRTSDLQGSAPGVRVSGFNVTAAGGGGGTGHLEAENATLTQAAVASNHLNYSGTGFVDYTNVAGSAVEWSLTAPAASTATLSLRYANGTAVDRPMDISVNGTVVAAGVSFPATANWDTWVTKTLTVSVPAGTSRITATATTANGGPNVDYLDVALAAPRTRYEAESATISQGVVESNHLNYSGTGFVNGDNVVGSYTAWTVTAATAGPTPITIRYANGTAAGRPADISVNGVVVSPGVAFPATANWDTWVDVTLTVNLVAGSNTIRVTGTTANGPANLDYLDVG
ncbi:glycosyl hydrolase 2 galactose-binding domain-containing protein [Hamadaea tsunoensis]|uniref:glycosyl hydrolase 2 galactose-binding domain-containing protein n=1 Tax=Hamadaea tsunoensis TaxID=53368 RepID=UPI0004076B39|nr:CBM35 domain-containing protein [Hamadaea tsunoensis]